VQAVLDGGTPVVNGPLEAFIYAGENAAHKPTSITPPTRFSEESPGHYWADQNVTASLNSDDGTLELSGVRGDSTGLILAGSYSDHNRTRGTVRGEISPFAWVNPDYDCSSGVDARRPR
jgi:hypothetical protein